MSCSVIQGSYNSMFITVFAKKLFVKLQLKLEVGNYLSPRATKEALMNCHRQGQW